MAKDKRRKPPKLKALGAAKKRRKLTPVEEVEQLATAALQLAQESRDEFKRNASRFDTVMESMSKTYAQNDRYLCDYVDDLQDRLYGLCDELMRVSKELSASPGVTEVTEQSLLDAANAHRVQRIEAYNERMEARKAEAEKAAEEKAEAEKQAAEAKPLEQMTEQELIAATEEASTAAAAEYPPSAQMFGGS